VAGHKDALIHRSEVLIFDGRLASDKRVLDPRADMEASVMERSILAFNEECRVLLAADYLDRAVLEANYVDLLLFVSYGDLALRVDAGQYLLRELIKELD